MSDTNMQGNKSLLNTLRLLYVEDDEEALQELAYFLKKRVGSLATASNGVEALELCKRQTFDVIICDLWMPEMDGMTLIQSIRNEGSQTPVIVTSAFSDIETILKAVDLGIVKYCVKPIEIDQLITSLNRIAAEKLSESDVLISSGDYLMERQERLALEKTLKSGTARLLKELTGKGPKQVHVSIGLNDLEIWATEVLSPIEASLAGTVEHAGMVPYIRKSLYTSYSKSFEHMVSDVLSRPATLVEVRNRVDENTDWIVFKLK